MQDGQITELLKRAVKVVDDAGVPDDLRESALKAAFGALAGGPAAGSPQTVAQKEPPSGGGAGGSGGTGVPMLDQIADGLGIDGRAAARLFAVKNGEPTLIVSTKKLPKSNAAAASDISLLTMAARQLGGVDDYTPTSVLREAAKRFGKFDTNNFSKSIRALDNYIMTEGKGSGAKCKLTHPGLEAAAELAQAHVAEGQP